MVDKITTVGLFGGSFNPPHKGHKNICLYTLNFLGLNQLWCLVSPQNPLKQKKDLASLDERVEKTKKMLKHPKICVTDIEKKYKTYYTIDTIKKLLIRFPKNKFIWIMGADNLIQIIKWKDWEKIFYKVSIVVIDRPGYGLKSRLSIAAQRFSKYKIQNSEAKRILTQKPPAWIFLQPRLDKSASTKIRSKK